MSMVSEADKSNLLERVIKLKRKNKSKNKKKKEKKKRKTCESIYALYEGQELILLKSSIFFKTITRKATHNINY